MVMRPEEEPTTEDKARASARLERVFQQADRFQQDQGSEPQAVEAAIDAAVREVRSQSP